MRVEPFVQRVIKAAVRLFFRNVRGTKLTANKALPPPLLLHEVINKLIMVLLYNSL